MKIVYTFEIESKDLGDRVKKARGDRSVQQCAQLAGISSGYWHKIERGEGNVSADAINEIERVLNVQLLPKKAMISIPIGEDLAAVFDMEKAFAKAVDEVIGKGNLS